MSFEFDHVAQQVPDIAAAVEWYRNLLQDIRVLYQDESWAFIEACGVKLAFVKLDQHPQHIAWRVNDAELERLAAASGASISVHRDKTRSFYLVAPGGQSVEIISTDPGEPAVVVYQKDDQSDL